MEDKVTDFGLILLKRILPRHLEGKIRPALLFCAHPQGHRICPGIGKGRAQRIPIRRPEHKKGILLGIVVKFFFRIAQVIPEPAVLKRQTQVHRSVPAHHHDRLRYIFDKRPERDRV